jgi:hypothetical protein
MAYRLSLVNKIYAAAVLLWETVRFLSSELRTGHTGSYGLKGHQFMLNELLKGRYSGRRRQVVEWFALMTSIRQADEKGIDMAFRLLGNDFPYEMLKVPSLEVLRSAAESRGFHNVRNRASNEIADRAALET